MTHLKPRSATKVLYQGDDMSRLAELKRAVDVAKRRAALDDAPRLGDNAAAEVAAAQQAFDDFLDEAAERALTVVLQSIGRRRFRDLVAQHPPRLVDSEPDADGKTHEVEHADDSGYGVNTETFATALLAYRDGEFVTIAEPKLSQTELERFVDDELSDGDYEQMWVDAYMLNRGPSGDPKLFAGSTNGFLSSDET